MLLGLDASDVWQRVHAQTHPRLQRLASLLPAITASEHAPATVDKYSQTFERFRRWCRETEIQALPATSEHVALYLVELMLAAESSAPVDAAYSAINWAHRKACMDSPCQSTLVAQTVQGCHRLLAKPAHKKRPLTMDQIKVLVRHFHRPDLSLVHLQMLTLVLPGFKGFMRWDDMARLRPENINITGQHMTVFLESRKNDQFREGHLVPISRAEDVSFCAVYWMEKFLSRAQHLANQPLFGKVRMVGDVQVIRDSMTYSRAREVFLGMLKEANIAKSSVGRSEFGLHSLRSGGVSSALQNPGVSVRLVQRHGGWKHLESMQGYVAESPEALLQVTKGME